MYTVFIQRLTFACLLAGIFSPLTLWAGSDSESEVASKIFYHARLFPRILLQEVGSLSSEQAEPYLARLLPLGLAEAAVDQRTQRFSRLTPAWPLLPGRGLGNRLTWSELTGGRFPLDRAALANEAELALLGFLQEHQDQLGITLDELAAADATVHQGGDFIQIHIRRLVAGLEVRGSFINAIIGQGNLTLLGIHGWGQPDPSAKPNLSAEAAMVALDQFLSPWPADDIWAIPELVWVPLAPERAGDLACEYRLVWSLHPRVNHEDWEGLIDAQNGEVLAFQSDTSYGTLQTRSLQGGVMPYTNDGSTPGGTEHTFPLPYANLTHEGTLYYTDAGGNLAECLTGNVTTTLQGQYFVMSDECGPIEATGSGAVLDLGLAPEGFSTDCDILDGASLGNTRAARTAYYELNKIAEMARSHLPGNSFLARPLAVTVNGPNPCNAGSSSSGLVFNVSTLSCRNTGEIATVLDHEWAHTLDRNDATPGVSTPGEGLADVFASLRQNTSCIGDGFARGVNCTGEGDACLDCDGLRDLNYSRHASGLPHDLSWVIATCTRPGGGPCGGGVYCESTVYAEAIYDLYKRDLQTFYGMDLNTARELVVRLTLLGSGGVTNWFQCSVGAGGCNGDGGYLNFLAADDDDGNLSNGTPHMGAIHAAFDRHQIACGFTTPTSFGCPGAPTQVPDVTATARDKAVELTWSAVTGAQTYRVYRAEGVFGCALGKTLVAETSEPYYFDEGLHNGFEYGYVVMGMGSGDSCMGPASACDLVTPSAQANFEIDTAGQLTIETGDGDVFLDNCEQATFQFQVWNVGVGSLTNLRIVGLSSPSHDGLVFNTTLPAVITSSLAQGCNATLASIQIEGRDLSFGETLQVEVILTADELSGQTRSQIFDLGNVESDWQSVASVTYSFESGDEGWLTTQGTFGRAEGLGNGGSSYYLGSSVFLSNSCDQVVSPLVRLSASSTLSLATSFAIEDGTTLFFDRANLAVQDTAAGTRSVKTPSSGRAYRATGGGPTLCIAGEPGYAGSFVAWATSSWNAAALGSAALAGKEIQLQLSYATDAENVAGAFNVDDVTLTQVEVQVPDVQIDSCRSCPTLTYNLWPEFTILDYIHCLNQNP